MTGTYSYKVMRHIRRKNSWLEKTFGIRIVLGADSTSKQSKNSTTCHLLVAVSFHFPTMDLHWGHTFPDVSWCLVRIYQEVYIRIDQDIPG